MSIKLVLESRRRFAIKEQIVEQSQTNYQKVLNYLKSQGFEVIENPPSELRIKTDEPRIDIKNRIENELQKLGLTFTELTHGSSFGRFELKADRSKGGSVYVYIKPKSHQAASYGKQYEVDTAETLKDHLPSDFDVKITGTTAGTDLVIKSQNQKFLHMELKTSSGADFGQFKLKYDPKLGVWDTMKTKNFLENKDLFQGIFDETLEPILRNKKFIIMKIDPFHYDEQGVILGLMRSPNTLATKKRLQKELFDGYNDINFYVDPETIQQYYAKKGDALISIQNKGVYALTNEASKYFEIPELKDSVTDDMAKVRFRIKPYMGGTSYHTFNCALKMNIKNSTNKLTNTDFLQKIANYLS